jgi:DNA modification methylase
MDRPEDTIMSVDIHTSRSASVRRFSEVDWDFPAQLSESRFSDIHWHPCRFPSQIPSIIIGRLTRAGDTVLDPFLGSGTTLVEAQLLGRRGIGIDLNPVACLVARAKTLPASENEIRKTIASVVARITTRWDELRAAPAPSTVQLSKWYTPATRIGLRKLWGFVEDYRGSFQEIFKSAFSATLLPACREDRHWGYICDNSTPKSNRERNVRVIFCDILNKYAQAYEDRAANAAGSFLACDIYEGNALDVLATIPARSVDCLITSPPYFGVADYVKAQRLSMEWFSLEIEPVRRLEIGARSKRHRTTAAEDYVRELAAVFRESYRALKRGAWAVILYGQSPSRPSAKEELLDELCAIGFKFELEVPRQIPDKRRQFPSLKDEFIILMRKA